jgi:RING-type zinc-finger/B-box zinc finger
MIFKFTINFFTYYIRMIVILHFRCILPFCSVITLADLLSGVTTNRFVSLKSTMAASMKHERSELHLHHRVDELTTCAICLDDYRNPRLLPCLHTFCLNCIDDSCIRGKKPQQAPDCASSDAAVDFECPLCRRLCPVTERGANEFPHNFFVESLTQAKIASKNYAVSGGGDRVADGSATSRAMVDPCVVCLEENDKTADVVPAELVCRDCRQKLCKRCAAPHRRLADKPHDVVELTADVEVSLIRMRSAVCDSCPGEVVKMYCIDCQKNICLVCVETDHVGHNRKKIAVAAEKISQQIDDDLQSVSAVSSAVRSQKEQMEAEVKRFFDEVDQAEIAILQRGTDLKRLIDERVDRLVEKLKTARASVEKQTATRLDRYELALTSLNGFVTYATTLREQGMPHDVTGGGGQLRKRAAELRDTYGLDWLKNHEIWAPLINVTWMDMEECRQHMDSCGDFVARVNIANFSRGLFHMVFIVESSCCI